MLWTQGPPATPARFLDIVAVPGFLTVELQRRLYAHAATSFPGVVLRGGDGVVSLDLSAIGRADLAGFWAIVAPRFEALNSYSNG